MKNVEVRIVINKQSIDHECNEYENKKTKEREPNDYFKHLNKYSQNFPYHWNWQH